MSNQLQRDIEALLRAKKPFREIERILGVRRETVSKYAIAAGLHPGRSKPANEAEVATGDSGQNRPKWPPDGAAEFDRGTALRSACAPYEAWIRAQVRLGRNAVSIYQDLVEQHGFPHAYNSVKRFVRGLKRKDPIQYDVLEFLPGEEAQVDYGRGAPTLYPKTGKHRRPRLFVMTLRYSRRSFRKVVWNSSKETWARLHEEAFRYFGGAPQYVVLDNLKEGVITSDIYEPELNAVYAQLLGHYGVVADPARVRDPDRKGTVEKSIEHTQSTALKGRRFDSIEAQNEWLMHWEERWAAPRVHGRTKRHVSEMFEEERPHLQKLPIMPFHYFRQEVRTVADDGLIEVERAYYFAAAPLIGQVVPVRIYDHEIEILHPKTQELIRRHRRSIRPGTFSIDESERIYNPSRETQRLLDKARQLGPSAAKLCERYFEHEGRPAQRRIRGLVDLSKHYTREEIEEACAQGLAHGALRLKTIKEILKRKAKDKAAPPRPDLQQHDDLIRGAAEYGDFWNQFAQQELPMQ